MSKFFFDSTARTEDIKTNWLLNSPPFEALVDLYWASHVLTFLKDLILIFKRKRPTFSKILISHFLFFFSMLSVLTSLLWTKANILLSNLTCTCLKYQLILTRDDDDDALLAVTFGWLNVNLILCMSPKFNDLKWK